MGLFHLANGLAMLLWPESWAARVVHLAAPDHLHLHFIADIAMAFLASGTCLLLGARGNARWAVAGAAWPALHGLVHVWSWITMGPPVGADRLREGFGVIAAGALGVVLAWLRTRQGAV
ncbi:MAG TPA: hypothetical protein VG387_14175 [Rhizomicrobium sp.]|nr:hypothetical protein [Rhizomicrobium sp.]